MKNSFRKRRLRKKIQSMCQLCTFGNNFSPITLSLPSHEDVTPRNCLRTYGFDVYWPIMVIEEGVSSIKIGKLITFQSVIAR